MMHLRIVIMRDTMHMHTRTRHMLTHTKRTIRVTLDVECYDDLDIESYDWNDVLGLEGDECVSATVRRLNLFGENSGHFLNWHTTP